MRGHSTISRGLPSHHQISGSSQGYARPQRRMKPAISTVPGAQDPGPSVKDLNKQQSQQRERGRRQEEPSAQAMTQSELSSHSVVSSVNTLPIKKRSFSSVSRLSKRLSPETDPSMDELQREASINLAKKAHSKGIKNYEEKKFVKRQRAELRRQEEIQRQEDEARRSEEERRREHRLKRKEQERSLS